MGKKYIGIYKINFNLRIIMTKARGTIGILTGGGDVPGLNPAIRAATIRIAMDIKC